jgi:hypothetical protein
MFAIEAHDAELHIAAFRAIEMLLSTAGIDQSGRNAVAGEFEWPRAGVRFSTSTNGIPAVRGIRWRLTDLPSAAF